MKVSGQSSPANYQAILDIFERFTHLCDNLLDLFSIRRLKKSPISFLDEIYRDKPTIVSLIGIREDHPLIHKLLEWLLG